VFPIRDDNPTLDTSFVTLAIIALNLAVWAFVQGFGSEPALSRSVCHFGAIPGELLGTVAAGTEVPLGPRARCVIQSSPSYWTPLSSMFMHGGWFHVLGNMWFLYVFGDNVEDAMGSVRFVFFYLLCGLAAAAAQIVSNPHSAVPMVGASGAIGGVMGAYAILYPHVRVHLLIILGFYIDRIAVPAVLMLGYWLLLQMVGGCVDRGEGGVAFWAHIGGFLAGIILVYIFRNPVRLAAHRRALQRMPQR
jgi:membrane associated rhomboid family serine protease